MEHLNKKRIVPSIFVTEGQIQNIESKNVFDYNKALEKALRYEADGADEIIFMDVTSIAERRRNLSRFIKDLSKSLKIPFIFGGGVNSTKEVEELLTFGASKIYVNSAAVRNPELINKIVKEYGKNSLLVAIDTRKSFGQWKVYLNGGKSRTEIDLINWVKMVEVRGAGEILVSTIAKSHDENEEINNMLKAITASTILPVMASVGVRSYEDFIELFTETDIAGVVSAHFFSSEENSILKAKEFLNQHFSDNESFNF
jgi:imidazole glycerol-phosphate synthase subunit HisF